MSHALRATSCGRCRVPVAIGDCVRTYIETRVDAAPLSIPGQALAVLTGRWTFRLVRSRGVWSISVRLLDEVTAALQAQLPGPVLVMHQCHTPLPTQPGPTALDLIAPPDLSEDDLAAALGLPGPELPPPF